ncbi:Ephrin type-A receptor 4-A, partial [Geodia barretti]
MVFYERIFPGLVALAVLLISHAGCVQDQAPGDGVAICTDEIVNGMPNPYFADRPMYSVNERPLMDSRDYNRLLLETGEAYVPWQSLDKDNNNTNDVITEWTQTGSATCAGVVTVCGFSVGAQENWLITQHINTVLPGGEGERLRKVTVQFEGTLNRCDISRQCRQSFELYKWETSAIDRNGATNTNNYVRVGRVSPAVTSGVMSFVDYHDIELGTAGGYYLGVVDLSTCVTLTRILVLYYVCPEETSELISRPEAIESQSLVGSPSVEGECVENSSTGGGVNPILICSARGQWHVIKPCLCNPGYQLNSSQDKCSECPEGTFSSGLGNGPCETCPANSEGTGTGLSLCPCLQDYCRAPYEGPSILCTQSPGRPSDVRVSNVTNTSAILSWSPPDNGGGRPLYEIVFTVTATGEDS